MKISADIHLVFQALFSKNNEELGEKGILGQPPRIMWSRMDCLVSYLLIVFQGKTGSWTLKSELLPKVLDLLYDRF